VAVTLFTIIPCAAEGYPEYAPSFTLKDPAGGEHTQESVLKNVSKGLVVIVTIPNAKHGPMQSRWQSKLTKKNWPEGMKMLLIEDLSQAGMVKDKALKGMKEGFKPDKEPLLLVDENGAVRRTFRVEQDATVCLVFDKTGKLVHFEDTQSSLDGTEPSVEAVQRVQKAMSALK